MRQHGIHLLTFLFAAIPLATFLRSFLKEHLDATKDRSVGTYKAGVRKNDATNSQYVPFLSPFLGQRKSRHTQCCGKFFESLASVFLNSGFIEPCRAELSFTVSKWKEFRNVTNGKAAN